MSTTDNQGYVGGRIDGCDVWDDIPPIFDTINLVHPDNLRYTQWGQARLKKEPNIVVNGVHLSNNEAMTVRVALARQNMKLCKPDALGSHKISRRMTADFLRRGNRVHDLMVAR